MLMADHLKPHRSLCWRGTLDWERFRKKRKGKRGHKGTVHDLAETHPCSEARESRKPRHTGTRNPQHPSRKAATKTDKKLASISSEPRRCGVGIEKRLISRLGWDKGQSIRSAITCWLSEWREESKGSYVHTHKDPETSLYNCVCRGGKQNSTRVKRKLLTGIQMDLPYQKTIHVYNLQLSRYYESSVLSFSSELK